MTKSLWKIRFWQYDENGKKKTVDFSGSNRELDEVIVFEGMYGIENYLVWVMHDDIGLYDFSTTDLDVKLYLQGSTASFFQEYYKPLDVKYDPRRNKYVLYALSLDSVVLTSNLLDYDVKSLSYKESRTPIETLKEILEVNGILKVQYYPHDEAKIEKNYSYFNPDIFDSVYDFIEYVSTDNDYEWFIKDRILHVGKEISAIKEKVSTAQDEEGVYQQSQTAMFLKVNGKSRPMTVMSNLVEGYRCIWAKHSVGKSGGLSKGCFVKIGQGTIDKYLYCSSLEGAIEKRNSNKILFSRKRLNCETILGNILQDEGNEYIDSVSVQKDIEDIETVPRKTKMNREEGDVVLEKQRITRSTPYLDHNSGLMFPVPTLENPPPHMIIHNIKGREEASVAGNFIFGNGTEEFEYPKKEKTDFRLQFPNGWCLYVKENGDTILQTRDQDPQEIPTEVTDIEGMMFKLGEEDSEFRLVLDGTNIISFVNKEHSFNLQTDGQIFMKGSKGVRFYGDDDPNNWVDISKGGEGGIKFHTNNDDILIESGGDGLITLTGETDMIVITPKDNTIELKNGEESVLIDKKNHKITLTDSTNKVEIDKSANKITVEATTEVNVKAGTTMKITSSGVEIS
jgi:hypothetical protein